MIEGSCFDLAEEDFLRAAGAFGDVELAFLGTLEARIVAAAESVVVAAAGEEELVFLWSRSRG